MDRYVVIGNPVAHSLSPVIHGLFAQQCGEAIDYRRMRVEPGDFTRSVSAFFDGGGCGASVTLPFKAEAFELAQERSDRAQRAGAANFLMNRGGVIFADNTDGVGLVADLVRNLGFAIEGSSILLAGAGGAARGILAPLLSLHPACIVIANRSVERAQSLAQAFADLGCVEACTLDAIPSREFDLLLNATSTSTLGEALPLPHGCLRAGMLAYDLAYGPAARAFVERARSAGARGCDGLGMLVEQAAEAFAMWRGKRPLTHPVLAQLRGAHE
jgi:shikimate dehydrogenase